MKGRFSDFALVAVLLACLAGCQKPEQVSAGGSEKAPPESVQASRLSSDQKRQITKEQFKPVQQITQLPASVRHLLHVDTIPMAEPGGPFEASAVVTPQNRDLPRRRMIEAACSSKLCLVHYEFGGYVHGYTIDAFTLDKNGARYLGTVSTNRALQSLDEIKKAIASANPQGYAVM